MQLLKNYSIKFCLLLALSSGALQAQELEFSVSINATNVQTTERAIFAEMETSFKQFLNDRVWTNDNFQTNEKIKGNLILTIQSQPTIGQFIANAQIQVIRPVYGTSHETLLLNFADRDWDFQFTQGQPMDFNDNRYLSNITSLLAYYAYIAIGLDYDSFSPLGGTEHYRKALNVVNNAQTSGGNGWGQFQNRRNRYWLIENLGINNQYEPVRQVLYDYHINGLDKFKDEPEAAQEVFKDVIIKIQEVNRVLPNAILIIAFMDAKNEELTNIFSKGQINIRRDVYNELLKLDPTRRSKYQKMVQN
ncbi:MAG: DUF4835 domain-containing protein [Cytophagales bacterium CG12_big_fil_rev_8_21_14_0_65_40_12]|nr:MAG: DUF4835 domain-containing protein [Cytophagales bacterium CG12_big_fil_rev_8_21_14_0_65_40_12]PIW05492.1 MAG: DUF4835 domain-containing protein [Cytophagales bacterium CG17_big_fil_post_rev_8_21_14_2_50_40_13]